MSEGFYDRHILPYLIDFSCSRKDIRRERDKVVPRAEGRVLEVGIGTGLNLAHYDRSRVERVVGVDPGETMHRLAQKRAARAGIAVELVGLSAEKLPLADASFDSVLVTYSLCTIPDPVAALREMRRVLKPGGHLLFCEHGRSPDADVRRWQEKLQPVWGKLAGGCHLGRDIPAILRAGGFESRDLGTGYIKGPRFLTYHYWGSAQPA